MTSLESWSPAGDRLIFTLEAVLFIECRSEVHLSLKMCVSPGEVCSKQESIYEVSAFSIGFVESCMVPFEM